MTLDEWYKLKPGDYIRYKTPKSKPRKVELVPYKGTILLEALSPRGYNLVTYETGYRKKFEKVI